jgi:CrcB protein
MLQQGRMALAAATAGLHLLGSLALTLLGLKTVSLWVR